MNFSTSFEATSYKLSRLLEAKRALKNLKVSRTRDEMYLTSNIRESQSLLPHCRLVWSVVSEDRDGEDLRLGLNCYCTDRLCLF